MYFSFERFFFRMWGALARLGGRFVRYRGAYGTGSRGMMYGRGGWFDNTVRSTIRGGPQLRLANAPTSSSYGTLAGVGVGASGITAGGGYYLGGGDSSSSGVQNLDLGSLRYQAENLADAAKRAMAQARAMKDRLTNGNGFGRNKRRGEPGGPDYGGGTKRGRYGGHGGGGGGYNKHGHKSQIAILAAYRRTMMKKFPVKYDKRLYV